MGTKEKTKGKFRANGSIQWSCTSSVIFLTDSRSDFGFDLITPDISGFRYGPVGTSIILICFLTFK